MKICLEVRDGTLVPSPAGTAVVAAYTGPGEAEKREILETLHLDYYDLESVFDPDEISRVEFAPDRVSIIWKRPKSGCFDRQGRFDVSSLGLFLARNRLTVVMGEDVAPLSTQGFRGVSSSTDVLLRFLLQTVRRYLSHLKAIKQLTVDLESKISASMENRYLLQMFALSESLVYYLNAIEANGSVLSRLRGSAEKLGFSKEQIESLDDIIIDNQQCARQAQIYTTVLSGLMDARGTIINNNMNVLLKNLTLINVVFLPLNLIASIFGMSEFSEMTRGLDWRLAYLLFALAMVLLGGATWVVLVRGVERSQRKRQQGK